MIKKVMLDYVKKLFLNNSDNMPEGEWTVYAVDKKDGCIHCVLVVSDAFKGSDHFDALLKEVIDA
jgi:hypothetical protein